jgi:hypothetical protein
MQLCSDQCYKYGCSILRPVTTDTCANIAVFVFAGDYTLSRRMYACMLCKQCVYVHAFASDVIECVWQAKQRCAVE